MASDVASASAYLDRAADELTICAFDVQWRMARLPCELPVDSVSTSVKWVGSFIGINRSRLKMQGFPSRAAAAVALAFALLAALSVAKFDKVALALTSRDAGTVVDLIEKLKTEFGDFAYDDDEADDWFEKDAASQKLITKAGFNQKSWKTAVDETMKGFFATIPEAEIKTVLDGARQRTESATDLKAEQKKAVLELIEEQRKEMLALREGGKPFVGVVAPFAQRIRKFTMENLGER